MHTTHTSPGVFSRLNELHLGRSERLRIDAYIHDGERIAELCSRAVAGVALAGHAVSGLAHGVKALFAKPARH
jgi:hypothetical protein